jgi:hypothetical protein
MRKRLDTPDRVDAIDRLACRQRSVRNCAQRRAAMDAPQLADCARAVLQPRECEKLPTASHSRT